MSSTIKIALRGGQISNSLLVLGLSSYVAYENNQSLIPSSSQINFLIFSSSFSIVALLFLTLAPHFSPKSTHLFTALVIQVSISGLYMAGFIALSVFLSRLLFCQGSVCAAARADAVFAAFSYAVWAASATISGIEMSRSEKQDEVVDIMEKKLVENV
ncbi:hypothetical protein EG329_000459 [Mollisiaceae sp. DMI_Dod_QoI]|nr:hypothetical protein EG329_000459 [Helotiales sp. DMI_Dod_QoI]